MFVFLLTMQIRFSDYWINYFLPIPMLIHYRKLFDVFRCRYVVMRLIWIILYFWLKKISLRIIMLIFLINFFKIHSKESSVKERIIFSKFYWFLTEIRYIIKSDVLKSSRFIIRLLNIIFAWQHYIVRPFL